MTGKGRKCARGYTLQSGPEGPSWCRSRSRPGRSKTTCTKFSSVVRCSATLLPATDRDANGSDTHRR